MELPAKAEGQTETSQRPIAIRATYLPTNVPAPSITASQSSTSRLTGATSACCTPAVALLLNRRISAVRTGCCRLTRELPCRQFSKLRPYMRTLVHQVAEIASRPATFARRSQPSACCNVRARVLAFTATSWPQFSDLMATSQFSGNPRPLFLLAECSHIWKQHDIRPRRKAGVHLFAHDGHQLSSVLRNSRQVPSRSVRHCQFTSAL
jgi:hypothetical protein